MREAFGDLWNFYDGGRWIAITTNAIVGYNSKAVMGRGVAYQAAQRMPALPFRLGHMLKVHGNHVFAFIDLRILSFPVKTHWKEKADLDIIRRSRDQLQIIARSMNLDVFMPRPGCGNGQLEWDVVKPIMSVLPDFVTVVEWDDPRAKDEYMEA